MAEAFVKRPAGLPVMEQTWDKLLFIHWRMDVDALRPLIPPRLAIDTYDGSAWISLTPLLVSSIHPPFFPRLPGLASTNELNCRTYVSADGEPGVWFFSLDASNPMAVWGARLTYLLPYFKARMRLDEEGRSLSLRSERTHPGAPPGTFEAAWTRGERLPTARPGSLDFFLVERYCLYTHQEEQVYRARIFHRPWPLCQVDRFSYSSTVVEGHSLPTPSGSPLLHGLAQPLDVEVWPLRPI